jgi:hypothetical protein
MAIRHRIVVAVVGEAPLRTEGSTNMRLFSWSNRRRVASVGERPKSNDKYIAQPPCGLDSENTLELRIY